MNLSPSDAAEESKFDQQSEALKDHALLDMGTDVDAVVAWYIETANLTHRQVAEELRAIARGWEGAI